MERPVTFFFTRRAIMAIVGAHATLILLGVATSIAALFFIEADVRLRASTASIGLGVAGAAAYYLRRVYRAAFDERLNIVGNGENIRERVATTIYLIGRPLIAVVFSFMSTVAIVLTYTAVAPEGAAPTEDLVYLAGSVGFVTGFLTGRAIERVEKTGSI